MTTAEHSEKEPPRAVSLATATVGAVITSFNKLGWMERNLAAVMAQTRPFDRVVVVDNCSSDGSIEMMRARFPDIELVVMPHSGFGACTTFNIGFETAGTEFVAILDDDVELPKDWVERMLARFEAEPESTALISSKVVEPDTPDWYDAHPEVNRERYMATFRGCASLARRAAIAECGYYDEDFFIYGNERDLSARLLSRDYRVLLYPQVEVQHGTPFGMKKSARSLYFHVRNLWWYLFTHVPVSWIFRFVGKQFLQMCGLKKEPVLAEAVGALGARSAVREARFGWWIVIKATLVAFWGLPRCLKKRKVVKHPDFSLPMT